MPSCATVSRTITTWLQPLRARSHSGDEAQQLTDREEPAVNLEPLIEARLLLRSCSWREGDSTPAASSKCSGHPLERRCNSRFRNQKFGQIGVFFLLLCV